MRVASLFYFSIFLILYAPSIYGKTYSGIIFLYILLFITLSKNKVFINNTIKLFIVYTFFMILIDTSLLFYNQTSIVSIVEILVYRCIPLVSFYIGYYMKNFNRDNFLKIIFYSGFLQSLIGIFQMLFVDFRNLTFKLFGNYEKYNKLFTERTFGRAIGSVGNPNYFAILIVIYIIFIICFYRQIKVNNSIKFLSFIISIYSLIFAQSNTGFILIILSLFIIFLLSLKNKFKIKNNFFSIIPIINFNNIKYFFSRIDINRIKSIGERIYIWNNLYNKLVIPYNYHFIIGYGSIFIENYTTDNYYLRLFLEYGAIGLFLFIFLYFILIFNTFKIKIFAEKKFILTLIFLVLIASFVSEPLLNIKLSPFIYLLFGFFI